MNYPPTASRQRGAVLILGLVILLVMTMIGVAAIQTTVLEERMAGNMRQRDLALHAAEAAVQAALSAIESQDTPLSSDPTGTNGVWPSCDIRAGTTSDACTTYSTRISEWRTKTSWEGEAASSNYDMKYTDIATRLSLPTVGLTGVAEQPRLAIDLQFIPALDVEIAAAGGGIHFYTVSALGFGADANVRAVVEAVVAKVYSW